MSWVRIVELVEVFTIYLSWVWLNERSKSQVPAHIYRAGIVGALVPMTIFLSVLTNALAGAPLSPGAYLGAALLSVPFVFNVVAVVRLSRKETP